MRRPRSNIVDGDMTPMIDMTFQLIAFFMVLINFTQSEQNERIQLPDSQLAKPPDAPLEYPITLHLTKEGTVIIGGEEIMAIAGAGSSRYLSREANVLRIKGKPQRDRRHDHHPRAQGGPDRPRPGDDQASARKNNFEKFALRAKEDVGY
jgi:hypothetical protein